MEEAKLIAQITKEASKEVVSPTSKAVGRALERTFSGSLGWLFIPFEYSAAYREVLIHRISTLKTVLSEKHEDQILSEISPQIAGPIFEKLRYIEKNSTLETYYITLLAKSLDKETVAEAHPAFADKLGQLSPDEAMILFH